jgi:hypothetical protein
MKNLFSLGVTVATLVSPVLGADPMLTLGDLRPRGLADPAVAGFARIDSPVAAVLSASDPVAEASRRGFRTRDGSIQVEIIAEPTEVGQLAAWLESEGATGVAWTDSLLEGWVPEALIPALDDHSAVHWVRRPVYAVVPEPWLEPGNLEVLKVGVTSEGLPATNVSAWHADGFTGDGIKVGVIDIEMYGYENLTGSELPPADKVHFQAFGGSASGPGEVHGTAVAEIIHDMAPGAELYLARIGGTTSNFVSAVQWMVSSGVRVVAMSITYFGIGPGDGSGFIQSRIDGFVQAADGVWAHSAGNYRDSHWQGQTVDADGNGWVELSGGDEIKPFAFTVSQGDDIRVSLQWNDWNDVDQDYSLHLFRIGDGEPVEVASADSLQTGQVGQVPTEFLDYTAAQSGRYGVGIFRKNVSEIHDMEYFSLDVPVEAPVEAGSLTTPGDAAGAMSTAAMAAGSPAVRSYSSAGPANGPGGSLAGGVIKPDLAAYDGVSTASYSGQAFGTSFACPHVAGAAAVVMSANPGWSGAEVRSYLETAAIDKGAAGTDPDFGSGRLNLGSSPLSSCSYELDQTAFDFGSGSNIAIVNVDTQGGCFWPAERAQDWLTLSADSGTGPGRVIIVIAANSGPPRVGTARIAGQTVTISQGGTGCAYSIDPASFQLSAVGGVGEVQVTTTSDCSWTAVSDDGWIQVTSGGPVSGSGAAVFSVGDNSTGIERTGSLVVADRPVEVVQLATGNRYVVAGVAETAGAAGTRWSTDLALANRSGAEADVALTYRHEDGSMTASVALADGRVIEFADAAAGLFGSPESAGLVDVHSSQPLVVTARTFNNASSGTFGQFLPGVETQAGISGSQQGVLSQLRSDDEFRTNIGFVNLGPAGVIARIRLFDGSGEQRGSDLGEIVPAGRWHQVNRAFRAANAGDCRGCYALVDLVGAEGGPVWAYASVVDNGSGDPTTIPLVALEGGTAGTDLLVAGIAETAGAAGTRWSSNLAAVNLSGGDIQGTVEYRHESGTAQTAFELGPGELVEWENVASLLGVPDSAGAAAIAADGPVVVTARTFNNAPTGTFGQFLPGLGPEEAIGEGEPGVLSQIKRTADFRTNVGFTNYSPVDCNVRVQLFGTDGARLGSDVVVDGIPAGGWQQRYRVFQAAGVDECPVGYAVVTVETPGCQVWAYASVVDNGSGDPTTVPVVAE